MELLIKAAVIGFAGTVLALLLKKNSPELALLLTLTVGFLVLGLALDLFSSFREVVDQAAQMTGLSSAILLPVLKCVGIGIVAKLSSDLCRDGGQSSIATSVELAGSFCALYVALPLIKTVLQMIGEMA
ncbi:MAG: stage III sporulation AC/AD family protein [Firmicutes bacterium]|nr:stage III sporulation AC/AD family protein [Bacillota bacterium]